MCASELTPHLDFYSTAFIALTQATMCYVGLWQMQMEIK